MEKNPDKFVIGSITSRCLGNEPALLPRRQEHCDWLPGSRKNTVFLFPYNESFIDRACSLKMAGYSLDIALFFFGPHKHAEKEELG